MKKLGNTFTYTQKYMEVISTLDEKDKYKVNWDLCWYGLYGEMPEDVLPISRTIIASFGVLLKGSQEYNEKQSERGSKGGRPSKATDEEIMNYVNEYKGLYGTLPSSSQIGAQFGMSGAAIRQRKIWKENLGGTPNENGGGDLSDGTNVPKPAASAFNF